MSMRISGKSASNHNEPKQRKIPVERGNILQASIMIRSKGDARLPAVRGHIQHERNTKLATCSRGIGGSPLFAGRHHLGLET